MSLSGCFSLGAIRFRFVVRTVGVVCCLLGLSMPGIVRGAAEPTAQSPAGVYTLETVDDKRLPAIVMHGSNAIEIQCGTFRIEEDGVCHSRITFGRIGSTAIVRDVSANFTQDGNQLQMQWIGAGKTVGSIENDVFTMSNEGVKYSYRKISAADAMQALNNFVGRWESLQTARSTDDEHFESTLNYEWVHSDQFLREIGTHEDGESDTVMYRWDADHGRYRMWSFRSSGEVQEAMGHWSATDREFRWTFQRDDHDPETRTTATRRFETEGRFVWSVTKTDAKDAVVFQMQGTATRVPETGQRADRRNR